MSVTVLVWVAFLGIAIWLLGHIIGTVLLFLLAAIVAYAMSPLVGRLSRYVPSPIAIVLAYIGMLCLVVGVLAAIIVAMVGETAAVARLLQSLIAPDPNGETSQVYEALTRLGLSKASILDFFHAVSSTMQDTSQSLVAAGVSALRVIVDSVLVGMISIYFVADGDRFMRWVLANVPMRRHKQVTFAVDVVDRVISGYVRGQLQLSTLMGLLVGVGMFVLRVPHPLFLGILAFVLEFVPMVGLWICGTICVLLAFTQSPTLVAFTLLYFMAASFVESNIASPRIMGRAVAIHPLISLFALLAGAEIFGLWGALLAAPTAGITQAFVTSLLSSWRTAHPDQYQQEATASGVTVGAVSGSATMTPESVPGADHTSAVM